MSAGPMRGWRALVAGGAMAVALTASMTDVGAQKSQGPPNALQGFSQKRDEQVKIRAAGLEVRKKDKLATFSGDFYKHTATTEMRCKLLTVFYEEETGT